MDDLSDKDIFDIYSKLNERMSKAENVKGDEFGLFDYHNETQESREQKWMMISYMIDAGKIKPEDIGMMFQNNPFFYDWYKRNIMSDVPIPETYH